MANTKKLIGAAAFSLALAGGAVAGALIGMPGSSGAQESTTSSTAADGDATDEVHAHRHKGPHLAAAAEALGMTEDELRAELEAGRTIAQVAEEREVDLDSVIDAIVAEVTTNIRERVTAMVNGDLPERGRAHHDRGPKLEAAATAIGISEDELRDGLESGQSLAEIAEANGVDPQTVIDALVEAGVPEDRATEIVNHEGGFRHHVHARP